ncbi:MAG: PAS domain S-box protein [Flavobacteriales bacterium]|nr:PAS domain S-box protein [Flavobacteriales bacterium]
MRKNDEVFYKICFDSLLEGLCITNEEGRIVIINSAFEEIFGYDEAELLGKKIERLIPESHRRLHIKHFQNYLKSPKKYKKGKGREFIGLHKNGRILDLEIGLNYFEYEGVLFAKALVSEIGTRKQKELRIKEKNRNLEFEVQERTSQLIRVVSKLESSNLKLKEKIKEKIIAENQAKIAFEKEKELNMMQKKFISMVSHEFKTPLSGMMTSASLIEKYNETQGNKNISNHAGTVKRLVIQMNSILDDFISLEKTESENYPLQLSKFKFYDLINKIVNDAQVILKEGQRIEVTPCEMPIEVWQDKKVVEIIVNNILYNAIKYSPIHCVIKIKIRRNDLLKISVEDPGIGIPKEAQKHIFDRFFRANNALTIQGTGIGLNTVKRYLDQLNGSIEIKSEENQGTKVILKLPLEHKKLKMQVLKYMEG